MAEKEPTSSEETFAESSKDSSLDEEEKEKLITEILELQNTLHDLSQRVHSVKEENEQLKADNQVLYMHITLCVLCTNVTRRAV